MKKRHPKFSFKKEPKHLILKVWWDYDAHVWGYKFYKGQGMLNWGFATFNLFRELETRFSYTPSGAAMRGWGTRWSRAFARSDIAKQGWATRRTRASGRKKEQSLPIDIG